MSGCCSELPWSSLRPWSLLSCSWGPVRSGGPVSQPCDSRPGDPPSRHAGGRAAAAKSQDQAQTKAEMEGLAAHLQLSAWPSAIGTRPDIYYIILDSYARNDALADQFGFDNSAFFDELESRGFYVVSRATSNYTYMIHSTPSILNLHYLDALGDRVPEAHDDLLNVVRFHATGSILQDLGYTYIHLDSGAVSTEQSPQADHLTSFTPSGPIVRRSAQADSHSDSSTFGELFSARFVRRLVHTTALSPLLGHQFLIGNTEPYHWWSPHRATQMFDYLSNPIEISGPKFVLAHIMKPHDPPTFDKAGNFIDDDQGFGDYHDLSVPSAYIGQLIYVNKLVLNMIDRIMQNYSEPPIIAITGDHGHGASSTHRHSVLSAFHFPLGGPDGLYPTISSVDHFRNILDFYFDFDLGLRDDRRFWDPSDRFDSRN